MAGIPAGDKLKITEKFKPNVKPATNNIELYLTTILGGFTILKLGPANMQMIGQGIMALGSVTTILEFISRFNPYKKLFENLNLKAGEEIPKYIKKRKTNYGYCVAFKLPPGLSTKDFDKNKLAIEQYLNKDIEIDYRNHRVFLKVYENRLDPKQEFRIIETSKITEFPIGVTFGDRIVTVDLEEVVHLLVAGQTGSGKSTLIRGIITNLIQDKKNSKRIKLYLHLIDLKNGAEFNVFRNSKMVKTFSRDIKEAELVLNKLVDEVERRYNLFFENNVVNIQEYNKLKGIRRLSYEICIIDEFADLQDEKGSISIIEHLARKSRAAGIHLILATQRPSADIINGNIKANVPCIIGLKTMNSLNSRIIIDQDGLETLRGRGHGYLQYSDLTEFQSMNLSIEGARELIKDTYIEKPTSIKNLIKDKQKKPVGVIDDLSFLKDLAR